MSSDSVVITLHPDQFTEAERVLARFEGLTASTFLYGSGVAGLRIANESGHLCLLPFQGQQIWDAVFHGRTLTMRSMFTEPVPTRDYLSNYGGFFLHCGPTAMGNPGPADAHPLHGELPNAPYRDVELLIGRDDDGPYMALTGAYQHTVAFTCNYVARPTVKLGARGGRISMDLSIRNLKHTPMDLMYLAHINFRPVDGATLIDAVPDDADHVGVRKGLPGQTLSDAHVRFVEDVQRDPAIHRTMVAGRTIDPELVMSLAYPADDSGWTHTMQLHPDGNADFVSHRPAELGHGVRWITRTADQDAVGIFLPATAGADGYIAEKAKGNVLTLAPREEFHCAFAFGGLDTARCRDDACGDRGAAKARIRLTPAVSAVHGSRRSRPFAAPAKRPDEAEQVAAHHLIMFAFRQSAEPRDRNRLRKREEFQSRTEVGRPEAARRPEPLEENFNEWPGRLVRVGEGRIADGIEAGYLHRSVVESRQVEQGPDPRAGFRRRWRRRISAGKTEMGEQETAAAKARDGVLQPRCTGRRCIQRDDRSALVEQPPRRLRPPRHDGGGIGVGDIGHDTEMPLVQPLGDF